jgi:protein-S-isoprenylcysteine O-methyltransferase Ste14
MSFEEKGTWIQALVVILVPGIYFATVFSQVRTTPVTDIDYQGPMLASVGAAITLLIAASIAIAIAWPKDADKSDERDKEINRYGEYIGSFVLYGGALVALGLALAEFDYFWIANLIYATLVLAGLITTAVKILAYRRGF